MRVKLRHKITTAVVSPFFSLFARLRYKFVAEPFDYNLIKGPYLIVSNHTTDLDALFLALCFKEPIYFVTNDHLFRLGFISKVMSFLSSPIPILKSTSDIKTIRDIRTLVADGGSIGLFPEGNRTYNGSSTYISVATGKLAKLLKIPIVIYNLEGGYLTSPRWSSSDRRGTLKYSFKRMLPYDTYRNLSPEELTELIRCDLYTEAPETLKDLKLLAPKLKFRGKNLAENLERLLYKCPICQSYITITSKGDEGGCSACGLSFKFTEEGYLSGNNLPFNRVLDWDLWQRADLNKNGLPKRPGLGPELGHFSDEAEPFFEDHGETLYEVLRAEKSIKMGEGRLAMYQDRLVFTSAAGLKTFYLSDIIDMVIYGRQNLQFSLREGKTFVFKNQKPRSALKYVYHYYYLRQKKRGEMNGFLGF